MLREGSNIQYEEDGNYDIEDRYIPSAPQQPNSLNHTRGHSVPSSTTSSLYADGRDEYEDVPVEAYVKKPATNQKILNKKKRPPTLSAKPRIQQSEIDKTTRTTDNSSSIIDKISNDSANYLYNNNNNGNVIEDHGTYHNNGRKNVNVSPQQSKMTRRATSSLPVLVSNRNLDPIEAHAKVSKKQKANATRESTSSRKPTAGTTTTKKKAMRGAPNLGGLASRRK